MTTALTEDTTQALRSVLTSERDALIREEARSAAQRGRFEKAIREAIVKLGASADEVSAATGLTVAEVREIAEKVEPLSDEALLG